MSFIDVTVGTAPVLLCYVAPGGVTVQNTGLEDVFLGGADCDDTGQQLAAGATTSVLLDGTNLYAVTSTGTTTLMVQNIAPMQRPPWPTIPRALDQ